MVSIGYGIVKVIHLETIFRDFAKKPKKFFSNRLVYKHHVFNCYTQHLIIKFFPVFQKF